MAAMIAGLLLLLAPYPARAELPAKCVADIDSVYYDDREEARRCLARSVRDTGLSLQDRKAAADLIWGTSSAEPALALLAIGLDSSEPPPLRAYCLKRLYWDVEMLSEYGRREELEKAMLALAFDDGEPTEARRGAIWGLFPVARREGVRTRFLRSIGGESGPIRFELVRSLYLAMDDGDVFSKVFGMAQSDPEPWVRFAATLALSSSLHRTEVRDHLERAVRQGGAERAAAEAALRGGGDPEIRSFFHLPHRNPATGRVTPPHFED